MRHTCIERTPKSHNQNGYITDLNNENKKRSMHKILKRSLKFTCETVSDYGFSLTLLQKRINFLYKIFAPSTLKVSIFRHVQNLYISSTNPPPPTPCKPWGFSEFETDLLFCTYAQSQLLFIAIKIYSKQTSRLFCLLKMISKYLKLKRNG